MMEKCFKCGSSILFLTLQVNDKKPRWECGRQLYEERWREEVLALEDKIEKKSDEIVLCFEKEMNNFTENVLKANLRRSLAGTEK